MAKKYPPRYNENTNVTVKRAVLKAPASRGPKCFIMRWKRFHPCRVAKCWAHNTTLSRQDVLALGLRKQAK